MTFGPGAPEADFEEYRRDRAFHAWKQAMWAAGLQLLTQVAGGRSTCFCGRTIGIADVESHVLAAHTEQVSWLKDIGLFKLPESSGSDPDVPFPPRGLHPAASNSPGGF